MRNGEKNYADQDNDIRSPQADQGIPTRLLEVKRPPDRGNNNSTLKPGKTTWSIKNLYTEQPAPPDHLNILFSSAHKLAKRNLPARALDKLKIQTQTQTQLHTFS